MRRTQFIDQQVVTDLTVLYNSKNTPPSDPFFPTADPHCVWRRVTEDLYLKKHKQQQSAWLYVAAAKADTLQEGDQLVVEIIVGEPTRDQSSVHEWESRPGGIWFRRQKFSGAIDDAVTEVDFLIGVDAVEIRAQWTLMMPPLQLEDPPDVPLPRLTTLRGVVQSRSDTRPLLKFREDGKFKVVQLSDTHMGTGQNLGAAHVGGITVDQRTVDHVRSICILDKPDFIGLLGDLCHHGILHTKTALYRLLAPIVEHSIPFAFVFGNHDDEGENALTRAEQMSLLRTLPLCLSEPGPGPEEDYGVGNFFLEVLDRTNVPALTFFFLDSHGGSVSAEYEPITEPQIKWFEEKSQMLQDRRAKDDIIISVVFMHIPLPEFADCGDGDIRQGQRREPTESSRVNHGFYKACIRQRVLVVTCGHDHLNDYCALLSHQTQQAAAEVPHLGPWLCHGGSSGGYNSYGGGEPIPRRGRVWEFQQETRTVRTWLRTESGAQEDVITLVEHGLVIDVRPTKDTAG